MTTFHPRTRHLLAQAGLAPREMDALDYPDRHHLPETSNGFGLIGTVSGTGKTWAMALRVGRLVEAAVRMQPEPARAKLCWVDGDVARDRRILWTNWHEQVEDIHRRRFDDVWIDAWSEWAEWVPLLVLDDLGRERYEGAKDPARAVLVRVLDCRHRCKLPVLWTGNITVGELTAFYGAALASRILGSWPAYEVEGQDMRLEKVSGGDR